METPSGGRQRPSIEERAARRRSMQRDYPDRYTGLIEVLRRDGAAAGGRWVGDPAHWHPVARKLVAGALIVIVLVAVALVANETWRQGRIDTWAGPTDTVTSGQELLACLPESATGHAQLPTWIRFGGRVYARSDRQRPLRGMGQVDQTGQVETGYRLDRMRILLPPETPAGEPPRAIFVVIEPAPTATIYQWASDCA